MTMTATETTTMNKQAAELILGLNGEYTLPELRTAFRHALETSPGDQSVYDAYACLVAELGGEENAPTATSATGINAETAAAAAAAVGAAIGRGEKYAAYEEPAPEDAPGWYKFIRTAAQHLPYRVMFMLLATLMIANYAAHPAGAMAFIGHVAFFFIAYINIIVPFITNPIRRLAIKLTEVAYGISCGLHEETGIEVAAKHSDEM